MSADPAMKARLIELLRHPCMLPAWAERAICSVTGDPAPSSIDLPYKAQRVITILQRELRELEQEIPL